MHTHIRCDVCVTCVCARSGSRCIHTGRRRQRLTEGVSEAWSQAPTAASANQIASCKYPIPFMQHQKKYVIGCCNYDGASAPRFRHALRQALTPTSQSARTHTSHTRHTGCVCALRSLGHGCVQEVKNDINTVGFFSHKPLVSCLRPSMCSYDGELFNLDFSVHVLFPSYRDSDLYLPLYD